MPASLIRYETPQAALAAAVDHVGSQAAFARLLSIAQPSVWKWLHKGKALPAEHVLAVEAETGISRHVLRPDIYGAQPTSTPPAPFGDMEPAR